MHMFLPESFRLHLKRHGVYLKIPSNHSHRVCFRSNVAVNDIGNASSTRLMAMSTPPDVPLDRVPGLQPPSGVIPNFLNPENYQDKIVACLTVFLAIATIFTAAKLYTKIVIVKSIAWEDCKY